MSQQTLLPLPHPAYGLMHLAGNLKDDNHFCAAVQAMVSAIEIATGHEERQSFALQLMWMLKTTLDMSNVEIIVHVPWNRSGLVYYARGRPLWVRSDGLTTVTRERGGGAAAAAQHTRAQRCRVIQRAAADGRPTESHVFPGASRSRLKWEHYRIQT